MWLSIIIPLYNCAPYIGTCFDSILQQGLGEEEYEVVVVDDGSTDGGDEVVRGYARQHPNIRLVSQENGGVSAARNRGISEARGEYIEFVDADDRLLPGGIATLRDSYLSDSKRPDMISMGMYTVDRYYDAKRYEHIAPHRILFEGTFLDYGQKHSFGWSSVSRIIKRQTLVESGVRFKPYSISEDVLFMMELFQALPKATLCVTNLDFYRYTVRKGSAVNTRTRSHSVRVVDGYINLNDIVGKMRDHSIYPAKRFDNDLLHFQCATFVRLMTSHMHLSDIRTLLAKANADGLYPMRPDTGRFAKIVNWLARHPHTAWLMSLPMSFLYPIVKPWIRRN